MENRPDQASPPSRPPKKAPGGEAGGVIAIAKSFFHSGNPYNPPYPPLKKGGNYEELQEKSPFDQGGFRGI